MGTRVYFPKVKEAREALRERALELYERHLALIDRAAEEGKIEYALEASQWLIEHMPASDDGERMIDSSAAKVKEVSGGSSGPTIQIGIALGPNKVQVKELGSQVVEAEILKNEK
jgi:hypothetical protein